MATPISNALSTSAQSGINQPKGKSELGKEDFLNLMIAQLKYQNPLEPLDGSEYTAQLAQFSSLEQLTNMSNSLDQSILANLQLSQSVNNTMTAALIGKEMKLEGESIQNVGQESIQLGYDLPASATSVSINIYDSNGALVKSFDGLSNTKGLTKLSWDFTDNNGRKVTDSNYSFKVSATATNGEEMTVKQFRIGNIDGIRYTEGGTVLVSDGIEYNMADVYEIINSTSTTVSDEED